MKGIDMISVDSEFFKGPFTSLKVTLYHEMGFISMHYSDVGHQMMKGYHAHTTTEGASQHYLETHIEEDKRT